MYESFFGLREPPFSVTPDPRFFFANPCYREAFATLRYGIAGRKGFIVVTGAPGTGKTTLLKRLLSDLDQSIHTAWIFHPRLGFPELLRLALSDLGSAVDPGAGRPELLGQFYDYLQAQLGQDRRVALLIDEAQDLSDPLLEDLRLLSNLEACGTKLLQIVLIGQPELDARLDLPALCHLKQRIVLRARIAPLADHEIRPYIEFRLAAAGYAGRRIFGAGAVARIARYASGIPRIINVICDNALLIAYAKSKKAVTAQMVAEAVAELRLEPRSWMPEPLPGASSVAAPPLESESENPGDVEPAGTPPADASWAIIADPAPIAAHPVEARWLGLSAALATLVWVLAVVEIFSYRAHEDYLAAVTQPIEKLRAAVAPIPEHIRNVLMTRARDDEAVRLTSAEALAAPEIDGARAARSPTPRKEAGEQAASNSVKAAPAASSKSREGSFAKPAVPSSSGENSGARRKAESRPGRFQVVANSFVREEPTADSEIIATLRPGTKIQLMGKRGAYFRIGAAYGAANIRGYVHEEDAFFEPID